MANIVKSPPKSKHGRGTIKAGETIFTTTAILTDDEGKKCFVWFVVPAGMTDEEAFVSQPLHGPFRTERQAVKNQRTVLLGDQCKVTEAGMWDPAWMRLQ